MLATPCHSLFKVSKKEEEKKPDSTPGFLSSATLNMFTSTILRNVHAHISRSPKSSINIPYRLHTSSIPLSRPTLVSSSCQAPFSCRRSRVTQPGLNTARYVASQVTNRPGSQTPSHAATNIKEEAGNAASELAKHIAGANFPLDSVKPINQSFVSLSQPCN